MSRPRSGNNSSKRASAPPAERRTINLRLLGATVLVLVALSAAGFFLHQHRQAQLAGYLADRAELLAEAGDWRKAQFYQQRFVQLHPADFDARVKLVDIATELTETRSDSEYLIRLLYETIGLSGEGSSEEKTRLRSILAEQLLNIGDLQAAAREAEDVIESGSAEYAPSALRVIALAKYFAVPVAGTVSETDRRESFAKVLPLLREAIEANPQDIALAQTTAVLYRTYPLLGETSGANATQLADAIMDGLVVHSPENPDALLSRYRYRKQYLLADAKQDLEAALALSPDHFEANLLAGTEAAGSTDPDSVAAAKRYFEAAIEARPTDERGRLALAQLLWRSGERNAAIGALDDAGQKLSQSVLATKFLLADYLLAEGDYERSGQVVESLKSQLDLQLSRLPSDSRLQLTNRLRLLEARVSAARGDIAAAMSLFGAVSASPENVAISTSNMEVSRQASLGVAQLFANLGRWDQVGQELSQLADRLRAELDASKTDGTGQRLDSLADPNTIASEYRRARIQAAEAFLRSGQPDEARQQLDRLAQARSLPAEAIELRLLVELAVQLNALPKDRHWEEFNFLLEKAKAELPKSEKLLFAQLQYELAVSNNPAEVASRMKQLLEEAQGDFGDRPSYWQASAFAYLKAELTQEADRAIQRFMSLETNLARRAEVNVAFLSASDRQGEALAWLTEQLGDVPADQQASLRRLEVQLLAQLQKNAEAMKKAVAMAESEDADKDALLMALELAIATKEWALAERFEKKLTDRNVLPPSDLDFYKAVRLVGQYETLSESQRSELTELVGKQRIERPLWRRGAALAAQLAEAQGDTDGAIRAYEAAVSLGDLRPEILERLTLHLYRSGSYDRAQQIIDRLMSGNGAVSEGAESLAISNAVKRQQIDEAIDLARTTVEEHPTDSARRLWLYNVLVAGKRTDEAAAVLATARQDFPDDTLVWNAQFVSDLTNKKFDEARALLDNLPPSIAEDVYSRSLTLAKGYEKLGDIEAAQGHYAAAIDLKPDDNAARLRYANLLLSSNVNKAKEQYEAVLKDEPDNSDARRKLAATLAASDGADWARIDELLAASGDAGEVIDRRLRAVLLTRRGSSVQERIAHCELARRILTGIVEDSAQAPEDIDRMLLAGAYEQEGMLKRDATYYESARRQLRYLIDRPNATAQHKELYLTYLLRTIDSLKDIPDAGRIGDAFLDDARGRFAESEKQIAAAGSELNPLQRQAMVALDIRLMRAEGRVKEAIDKLKGYASEYVDTAEDPDTKARLVLGLASLYSLLDANDLAEPRYRELMAMAPGARLLLTQSLLRQGKATDAVNLFLEEDSQDVTPQSATVLASILSADVANQEDYSRAWPAISGALEKHDDDVELLMSVAVLQVTRGQQEEAIRLFRRVVELAPENTLALNNLATLLGERESDRAEALTMIERAIKVAGRKPALLDTQGTIQLRLGSLPEAVQSLEEAVATVNVDSRYYFHLAAAYLRSNSPDKAMSAFNEARQRGIDKAVLTTADQELMKELEAELKINRTALKQAS